MRILLVEDNEYLGEAIEKRLRSAGHSVCLLYTSPSPRD